MYVLAHMCSYVCVSANAGSTDRVTVGLKRPSWNRHSLDVLHRVIHLSNCKNIDIFQRDNLHL